MSLYSRHWITFESCKCYIQRKEKSLQHGLSHFVEGCCSSCYMEDALFQGQDWFYFFFSEISKMAYQQIMLINLCYRLGRNPERETMHTYAKPVKVLSAIWFLATGTFQRDDLEIAGMLQPALSRIIPTVLDASFIHFPYTKAQLAHAKQLPCKGQLSQHQLIEQQKYSK